MEVEQILKMISENAIRWIHFQYVDLIGRLHQVTVSSSNISRKVFEDGIGKLDGSSVVGFVEIHESDMVLVPVEETFAIVPWESNGKGKTARFLCKVYRSYGMGRFEKDPRQCAEKAEEYALNNGYISFWGPEIEFFIFRRVKVDLSDPRYKQSYIIESDEAPWSCNGGVIDCKHGYHVTSPFDIVLTIRKEIAETLEDHFGFSIEAYHHEVATAGQGEITFRHGGLVETADRVVTFKYVAWNIAKKYDHTITFMPKPIYGDNGSGMHTHVSLWNRNVTANLFYDPNDGYAELSQLGRYFIGGLMEHARALSAIVSPTTNSYKRLVPGYEAPVYIAWSKGNRSAIVRVPVYHRGDPRDKRIEYRPPDPATNPYLAFAAILAAGLDGIKKEIDPGDPVDENIYLMPASKRRQLGIKELPRTLWDALDELECDNEFLKPVMNKELLETYIEVKREECRKIEMYTTPVEIYTYLNV
ncbi:MAG: type I glutamate--ammonia ligase [Candidatus Baldrarchaeia archaeon]